MAVIQSLTRSSQDLSRHKTDVDATFQSVMGEHGDVLFHLATYGSKDRASVPKVSQTVQLDLNMASALIASTIEVFGEEVIPDAFLKRDTR